MTRETDLAYWINEREMMRLRKEELNLTPYSEDPLMANIRYCNIRRENDRVTRWVKKYWRDPNAGSAHLTLLMVAARMINWPPTLAEIPMSSLERGDVESWLMDVKNTIRLRAQGGDKAWTSAYTISTCGRSMAKEDYVVGHVLAQVAALRWDWEDGDTLQTAWEQLTNIDGLGSFLAAQVIADLKNTEECPLFRAPDWWKWSTHGPGSLRGLAAFFGYPRVTPANYQFLINQCYELTAPLFAKYVGQLHRQDFQNCLCEFSKYIRMKEGDGRARNTYSPGRRADYHI